MLNVKLYVNIFKNHFHIFYTVQKLSFHCYIIEKECDKFLTRCFLNALFFDALFFDALFYDALFLGALFLGALFLEPPTISFSKLFIESVG